MSPVKCSWLPLVCGKLYLTNQQVPWVCGKNLANQKLLWVCGKISLTNQQVPWVCGKISLANQERPWVKGKIALANQKLVWICDKLSLSNQKLPWVCAHWSQWSVRKAWDSDAYFWLTMDSDFLLCSLLAEGPLRGWCGPGGWASRPEGSGARW